MTMHVQPRDEKGEEMVYMMFHAEGPPVFYCNFCDWDLEIFGPRCYKLADSHNAEHQKETAFLEGQGFGPYEVTGLLVVKHRWDLSEDG